jgi:hypothetical protein
VLLSRVRGDASASSADAGKPVTESSSALAAAGLPPFPSKFSTAAGRAIANAVLRAPSGSCAELFQPRRMAFVFFADEGESEDEDDEGEVVNAMLGHSKGDRGVLSIPETLLRSKVECPEPPEGMNAAADAAVLREVVGVMQAVKIEAKIGKDRRKGKASDAVVRID